MFSDEVRVSPELLPDYEEKIAFFFEEHLHTDDEVRYVIDGCGYFDVRDKSVGWIVKCLLNFSLGPLDPSQVRAWWFNYIAGWNLSPFYTKHRGKCLCLILVKHFTF